MCAGLCYNERTSSNELIISYFDFPEGIERILLEHIGSSILYIKVRQGLHNTREV